MLRVAKFALLSIFATCLEIAAALPRAAWTDPAFSVPTDTMAAAVTCPKGIQGRAGGIVFLVHGTGSAGSDSWAHSPYALILPDIQPGYDVCWVDLPGHSLGNAATSSEYVAYNIQQLAAKSATGKVFVIGHSQGGGLNIPWALDFFPSTQPLVAGFVALSGDFHGTSLAQSTCSNVLTGGYCAEAVMQQAQDSQLLRALNIDGGHALVGTTSIFTIYDEVIPPEPADSTLTGASNILLQSLEVCGPLKVVDHFAAAYDSGFFGLAVDAIAHGGMADPKRLDKAYCVGFKGNTLVDVANSAAFLEAVVKDLFNTLTVSSPYVAKTEPPLPEYVCQRYPNGGFNCAQGPLTK